MTHIGGKLDDEAEPDFNSLTILRERECASWDDEDIFPAKNEWERMAKAQVVVSSTVVFSAGRKRKKVTHVIIAKAIT